MSHLPGKATLTRGPANALACADEASAPFANRTVTSRLVTYQREHKSLWVCDSRVLTNTQTDPTMMAIREPPASAHSLPRQFYCQVPPDWRQMEAGPGNEGPLQHEDFAPQSESEPQSPRLQPA